MIVDADGNVLVRQIGFLRQMRREQAADEPSVECVGSQSVDVDESADVAAKLIS
jgi:hypothetical protein